MPLYEFQCLKCGTRFERIVKFSDPPVKKCPSCGARKVEKLVSSPAFQFKGTGWYVTDYARKTESGTATKKGGDAAKDGAKDETAAAPEPAATSATENSSKADADTPAKGKKGKKKD